MSFVWDLLKAAANLQKHGVSFEEAQSGFHDPLAVIVDDQIHSEQEPREIIIGYSDHDRLLFVCFTERTGNIRLIAAREATDRSARNMKTIPPTEPSPVKTLPSDQVEELMADDMSPEYDIDYSQARPNRFATRLAQTRTIELESDVAAVFTTPEAVNAVLRALIQTMPEVSPGKSV